MMNDPVVLVFGIACLILLVLAEPFLNCLVGRHDLPLGIVVWIFAIEGVGGIIAVFAGWHPPAVFLVPVVASIIAVLALRFLHTECAKQEGRVI